MRRMDDDARRISMRSIKSKNTKPEIIVRKHLHALGFRFRIHVEKLPGKPDIVLPKYKTAIFVHGCFWHCHEGCRLNKIPRNNIQYWEPKLFGNVKRDEGHIKKLISYGWKVLIVWECSLKKNVISETLKQLSLDILSNKFV